MSRLEELGRCLEKLQELKKYPRKTCGYDQRRGHLIRVLNERGVCDGGKLSPVVGDSQMTSSQFDIMSETHFSCDTVGRELWLATLSSPLCPKRTEIFASPAKQSSVFILTDFKSDFFMFHS